MLTYPSVLPQMILPLSKFHLDRIIFRLKVSVQLHPSYLPLYLCLPKCLMSTSLLFKIRVENHQLSVTHSQMSPLGHRTEMHQKNMTLVGFTLVRLKWRIRKIMMHLCLKATIYSQTNLSSTLEMVKTVQQKLEISMINLLISQIRWTLNKLMMTRLLVLIQIMM